MRWLCACLGWLTGKSHVKCEECKNLDSQQKCYGHKMPEEALRRTISCGFWSPK